MQKQHTFFKSISKFKSFFDVSLHSACSQNVRESLHTGIVNNIFPKEKLSIVFAQYLFPCQTLATARIGFYKEKSSVLHEDISARPNEGQKWAQVAHWAWVSNTLWVLCNPYQVLGYIVTPLERCTLQHDTYDRHN